MKITDNKDWNAFLDSTNAGLYVYRDFGLELGVNTSDPFNLDDKEGQFLIYFNKYTSCHHYYDLKKPSVHGGLLKFISILKQRSKEESLLWLNENYSVISDDTPDSEEYSSLELKVIEQTQLGRRIVDLSRFSLEQIASNGEVPLILESKEWGTYAHRQDPISIHAFLNGLRLGDAVSDLIDNLDLSIEISNEEVDALNTSIRNRKLLNALMHRVPWARKYDGLINMLKEHGFSDGLPLVRYGVILLDKAIAPSQDSISVLELESPTRRPILGYQLSEDCVYYSSPYWIRIDKVRGVLGSLPQEGLIFGLDLLGDDLEEVTITSSPFDALVLSNYGKPSVCVVTKGMQIEASHIEKIKRVVSAECEISLLFEKSDEWKRRADELSRQFGLTNKSSGFYTLIKGSDQSVPVAPSQVILELNRARFQTNNQ